MGGGGDIYSFFAHHVLNWKWYKNLFRGKYTPRRILQVCVDMLTLLSMIALMYSGIVLSRYVFSFLPIESGLAMARHLHILGSYWGFLLMSLHLGLHWNMVLGAMKRKISSPSRNFHYICFGLEFFVALYGVCVFIKRDFFIYLFLQSEFVFLDYEEPKILFYLDYLALMGMCIFISHYMGKFLQSLKKKEGGR